MCLRGVPGAERGDEGLVGWMGWQWSGWAVWPLSIELLSAMPWLCLLLGW